MVGAGGELKVGSSKHVSKKTVIVCSVTRKLDPHSSSPSPNACVYQNTWTPWIIYFNFAEIFGLPDKNF